MKTIPQPKESVNEAATAKKRMVLYARVSSKLQEDNSSVPSQIKQMQAYCQTYDYDVVGTFDDVSSGGRADNRPGLQTALALVFDGHADGLICCYMDRFARSTKDFIRYVEEFRDAGKTLVFIDVRLDTSTAMGEFAATVLMSAFQMLRKQTSEKTKAALRYIKEEGGGYTNGQAPYGWSGARDRKGNPLHHLIEIPYEQNVIKSVIEQRYLGKSLTQIASWLNNNPSPMVCQKHQRKPENCGPGHHTRHGASFTHVNILRILRFFDIDTSPIDRQQVV